MKIKSSLLLFLAAFTPFLPTGDAHASELDIVDCDSFRFIHNHGLLGMSFEGRACFTPDPTWTDEERTQVAEAMIALARAKAWAKYHDAVILNSNFSCDLFSCNMGPATGICYPFIEAQDLQLYAVERDPEVVDGDTPPDLCIVVVIDVVHWGPVVFNCSPCDPGPGGGSGDIPVGG